MSVIKYISTLLLFLIVSSGFTQEERNYSARQYKNLAMAAERINDPMTAAHYYEKYLEKRPSDMKVTFRLAERYREFGSFERAKSNYKAVFFAEKEKIPLSAFYYAEMLRATGNCQDALPIYDDFRKEYRGEKDDRKYTRLAKFAIAGCKNGDIDTNSIKQIVIKPLPEGINGDHIQGSPIYLENGDLVYNSLKVGDNKQFDIDSDSLPQRNFYVARANEESWEDKGLWDFLTNVDFDQQELANGSFNLDKTRFYFSSCERNDFGKMDCDIYRMEKKNGQWTSPRPIEGLVNTKSTETQVAVGMDEKERETIYFVSDRKEGKGGLDIWYSTYYEKKDSYKTPRNCGSKINSVGDEITPFINPLNRKLFFSSNGHPGNGGFDVFNSAGQRSRWVEPENIGKEVNSPADELYYVLNPNGEEGIFASNRLKKGKAAKGYCCDDLYYFKDLNKIKITLSGIVRSYDSKSETNKVVKSAKLRVYQVDPITNELFLVQSKTTNPDGSFNFQLESDKKYIVKAEGEDYLTEEKKVSTEGIVNDKKLTLDYDLEEYKDKSFELEDVYFKFNSDELVESSKVILDEKLLTTLVNNPELIIEIGSHTDSKGTEAYNKRLSQQRAEMVMKYLKTKGIDKKRLSAKGYGEALPKYPNTNPDGSDNPDNRAKNRRVEFKVVGKIEISEDDDEDE